MRGKGDWLFEEICVRDHYESLMYQYTDDPAEMKRVLETEALRLWKVQELLKEYGIHIFVDINPGKDLIYPEYLPKNRSYLRKEGIHAYEYLKKRFDELGVDYIDLVPVFQHIKDSVDYPLFTQTGTHWSNIASVYAFDTIVRYMETIGNQNLVNLDIGSKYYDTTRPPDNDLELILNLASPIKSPRNQYAEVWVKKDTTSIKPNFLAVGDSYYWNIVSNIPLWEIFQSYPYWYYNSTIYGDDAHTSTLKVDIEQELMRPDYIMLVYSPVTLYEFSSFFLPRALLHLCYDKVAIDSAANCLVKTFKSNPKFCAEMAEVAKERHVSMEQIMYENACYMLRTDPEVYFEELQGDKLPVSRNKDLMPIRSGHLHSAGRR